ncbi:MAG: hypothetical protein DI604_20110 [Delftia acidovorans]|nr:MAG: hypothetical protein DI604_20110 [Delftia acidovorans]
MDSVHHIWCPLSSQEYQDLPDGAETTLTSAPPLIQKECCHHCPLFARSRPSSHSDCPLCAKSGIWSARGSNVSYQRC